jgi:hypothetical protein
MVSLLRCAACRRRFATPPAHCCGGEDFQDAPVRDEAASAQATTAVWAGVSEPQVYLVIAQLPDLAVLATSAQPLRISDRLRLDDAPGGGFTARREEGGPL